MSSTRAKRHSMRSAVAKWQAVSCDDGARTRTRRSLPDGGVVSAMGPSHVLGPSGELAQQLDAALERGVAGGRTETEVRVGSAKRLPGNEQQVVADRLGDEGGAVAPRHARKQVERPARPIQLVVVLQTVAEPIAFVA